MRWKNKLRLKFGVAILAVFGAHVGTCAAAGWPPDHADIIISNSLGSGEDVMSRALGAVWGKSLGTNFIYKVENGASGRIAFEGFLKEAPSQIVLLSTNITASANMYARSPNVRCSRFSE